MKILLVLFALIPLGFLAYTISSAIDPIKLLYTYTGVGAIVLLLLSLFPSSCQRLCKVNFLRLRKSIGLLAFLYTLLHVSIFLVLDSELDMVLILTKSLKKPFIYVGFLAFSILLFMALTSIKKLFKRFVKYHKLVYIALLLALTHSFWAQKVAGMFEYAILFFAILLLGERFYAWLKSKKQTRHVS